MKNSLTKVVLATMIATAPLAAGEYAFATESLFAIEGGVSSVDTEAAAGVYDDKEMANIGLKIGAQTENYRIFLSARHYDVEDLNSLNTYGAEVQYMFNFSKPVNFFVGANAGIANITAATAGVSSESESPMYYGVDAGFNIHASELIDIELGARYMGLEDIKITANDVVVDDIVTAYASVIIKWKMD